MSSPNFRRGRGRSSRSQAENTLKGGFLKCSGLFAVCVYSQRNFKVLRAILMLTRAEGCGDLGGTAAREAGVSSLRQARFALSAPTSD
jgi:hypothetical protein